MLDVSGLFLEHEKCRFFCKIFGEQLNFSVEERRAPIHESLSFFFCITEISSIYVCTSSKNEKALLKSADELEGNAIFTLDHGSVVVLSPPSIESISSPSHISTYGQPCSLISTYFRMDRSPTWMNRFSNFLVFLSPREETFQNL